ncbi:Multicopper oxidase with three cupredoxin domains (includes cell division protein FtsP and spore coat protein CotA) [Rhizobium mongolense subsp. loessense]|uniref:Multicopper oxidase with three cupredoxin domains (Includes cell division protein FtsP and spore coat protein CotA) n=1 Tax=Rhizobium mongolense subsp. loessense TaxID=158890 RepID=A0A1G4TVX3_9HYPH|nr:multicopper oxidase family protein [Rhizobium mongolense]SCW85556.1 Multicopper oxidase with three cupredoxin domains (includes cell division protein FtsP and spore coat protein CotA) [Rhizobium mongolense subsp. loessense]
MKRRDFLNGLMVGAAALGTSAALHPIRAWSQDNAAKPPASPRALSVGYRTININRRSARVFGLIQPDGKSGLTLEAGTEFDVALSSVIDEPTLIHWHGLTPPWAADGVPDNPAALLQPTETRRYTFPVGAGGTHWMHAHTLQEQNLLAAPLIVRTADDLKRDEQEVVVLLHDFSFLPAEELLAKLKGNVAPGAMPMDHGSMQGMAGMQHVMPANDMSGMAMPGTSAMDLNDIDYDAYLANDRTLDDPEVVRVDKGGRVRLRIINGATATVFTIDTGRLSGELVAVDGQGVQAVTGTSFPVAMGQRLDIRLSLPKEGGAFPVLALREGAAERTGVVLATAGADVRGIPVAGETKGPVLGLELEQRLRPVSPLAYRAADRRFGLSLTGDMAAYSWGIDGADGLVVKRGERIEVAIRNMSMMAHPMHLHGHHFQITAINGTPLAGAVRDTVLVPPMASVTVAFDADNPGRWPLHCHHLYHMATGMMAYVTYDGMG